jgi:hypothetical protein
VTRRALISAQLIALAPLAPPGDRELTLDHAEDSPGLRKASPAKAAWLALVAYVRHNYTDYDGMLEDGYDVSSARHFCLTEINAVLCSWGCSRLVSGEEDSIEPEL